MSVKLKWLGTGSAFNYIEENTASVVQNGDRMALIDCGFTVPAALMRHGLIDKVTDIYITHTHSDHCGGLELLAQYRYFVAQRKGIKPPRLIVPRSILENLRHLENLGLGYIQDDFGRPVKATLETYFNIDIALNYKDFKQLGGSKDDLVVLSYQETEHVPSVGGFPSYGIRLTVTPSCGCISRREYYFTGDTRKPYSYDSPHIAGITVFHDCQLFEGPNEGAGDVHTNLDQLGRELPKDRRKHTWLVHYGTNWQNHQKSAELWGFAGFVKPGQEFEL